MERSAVAVPCESIRHRFLSREDQVVQLLAEPVQPELADDGIAELGSGLPELLSFLEERPRRWDKRYRDQGEKRDEHEDYGRDDFQHYRTPSGISTS